MIDPLLIGLRMAIILLCVSGIASWWRTGLPTEPVARWRTRAWLIAVASTVIFWSPVSLAGLAHLSMPGPMLDGLRLGGMLGYILAALAGAVSFTLGQGGTMRRAKCAVATYVAMTAGCVLASYAMAGAL